MCQFSVKMNNFEFFAQICPKKDLGLETEKSNAWNKNQHCRDTLYANFQPNWTALSFSVQICPKMNLVLKFRKLILEQESAISRLHVYQFSGKTNNFDFFGPNLPQNGFRIGNSEN